MQLLKRKVSQLKLICFLVYDSRLLCSPVGCIIISLRNCTFSGKEHCEIAIKADILMYTVSCNYVSVPGEPYAHIAVMESLKECCLAWITVTA